MAAHNRTNAPQRPTSLAQALLATVARPMRSRSATMVAMEGMSCSPARQVAWTRRT